MSVSITRRIEWIGGTKISVLSTLTQESGVLLVHLLNQCNLQCRHCYLDAGPEGEVFLPVDLVLRSLEEAGRLGFRTVILTGGEPLLYPDIDAVLDSASKLSNLDLHVSTNGTLIGPEKAKGLSQAGASVQVSIDGPAEFHDEFRGLAGSFSRARAGIEHLVAQQVPVTVVVSVCEGNFRFLPWLAEWALKVGAGRISVQPILQVGRGSDVRGGSLSNDRLSDLFIHLSDIGHRFRASGLRFSLAYRTRDFLLAHPCAAYVCDGANCHRRVEKEIKKLVIREDGTVLPEIPTLNDRFALGNLSDGTLAELIPHYFQNGYAKFHRLCSAVYQEVMPAWDAPIIPWDELTSQRSWTITL